MANIDVDALQTFSTADLIKITKAAIAQVTLYGQAYDARGKSLTRADLDALRRSLADLEQQAADEDAAETGSGNVLVKFGRS